MEFVHIACLKSDKVVQNRNYGAFAFASASLRKNKDFIRSALEQTPAFHGPAYRWECSVCHAPLNVTGGQVELTLAGYQEGDLQFAEHHVLQSVHQPDLRYCPRSDGKRVPHQKKLTYTPLAELFKHRIRVLEEEQGRLLLHADPSMLSDRDLALAAVRKYAHVIESLDTQLRSGLSCPGLEVTEHVLQMANHFQNRGSSILFGSHSKTQRERVRRSRQSPPS